MKNICGVLFFLATFTLFCASKDELDVYNLENDIWEKKEISPLTVKILILESTRKQETPVKYSCKVLLAKIYRAQGKDSKALDCVSDCGDFQRISVRNRTQTTSKDYYLDAFLELAHIRATDKEKPAVRDAMKMLDYAVANSNGLEKPATLFKYAQILLDLKEAKRALTYLNNALNSLDEYSAKALPHSEGSSSNESEEAKLLKSKVADMRNRILKFQLEINMGLLAEEFGEGYALYVKMRILYQRGLFDQAAELCKKLAHDFPESIYGDAGRLHHALCMEKSGSPKKAEAELEKFIKDSPNGLYRGEAWMTLGKMELESEFEEKKASASYGKALEWFRKARERRDAVDIYSLPENVISVAVPAEKLSGLDEWNRKVFKDLPPEKIVNEKVAPWYVDEMETQCLFMIGFFNFLEGDYEKAKGCFIQIRKLDADFAKLDSNNIPNALWRLESACNVGRMLFSKEQKKCLKGTNKLLCALGELNYIIEKQDTAFGFFGRITVNPESSEPEKALAQIGMAASQDLKLSGKSVAEKCLLDASKLNNKWSCIASDALFRLGCLYQSESATQEKAVNAFNEYIAKYQEQDEAPRAIYRLAVLYKASGRSKEYAKISEKLLKLYPKTCYAKALKKMEDGE